MLLGECVLCERRERPLGSLCLVFPQVLLHTPFSLADSALSPLTVINLSYEYDYMLYPVSPPSDSSDPGRRASGGLPTHLS